MYVRALIAFVLRAMQMQSSHQNETSIIIFVLCAAFWCDCVIRLTVYKPTKVLRARSTFLRPSYIHLQVAIKRPGWGGLFAHQYLIRYASDQSAHQLVLFRPQMIKNWSCFPVIMIARIASPVNTVKKKKYNNNTRHNAVECMSSSLKQCM